MLREHHDDDSTARDDAGYIRQEVDELASITADGHRLLESADANTELERIDLSAIVRDEVRKLRASHPELDVETDVPEDVHVVADDFPRRLLVNLLENAVDHNDTTPPTIAVTVIPSDDAVTVRVRDNGPGVPENMRTDLFDRTTRKDTIHGIGLSIVDMLADRYGGRVELTETGPDGSVFSVDLPRANGSAGSDD